MGAAAVGGGQASTAATSSPQELGSPSTGRARASTWGSHWRGAGTSLPLKLALHENVAPWRAPPLGLVGFGSMPVLDKGAS